jgi:hypothetical protein
MGHFVSQAVYVTAKLGVADILAEGPSADADLAAATRTDADALRRVLTLVAEVGLLERTADGRVALTRTGECLRSDVPDSVRSAVILFGEEPFRASGALLHAVSTGEPGFDHVFGTSHFRYLERDSSAAATFHAAMAQLTALVADELIAACDLPAAGTLVDVGGGAGLLLAQVLEARPGLHGVLFEAPEAATAARAALERRDLDGRCEVVAGDLFDAVPGGGDVYVLKSVLHTLGDDDATRALQACSAAMPDGARLLVVERVVPDDGDRFMALLNDVVMLTVTGGCERTLAQYQALSDPAGLALRRAIPGRSGFSVLEYANARAAR